MRWGRRSGWAGLLILLAGCAANLQGLRSSDLPARARVPDLKPFVQSRDHCGPASLATLLNWAGDPVSPEALAPRVFLPGRSGTLPIDLSREVRARGFLAYQPPSDLPAVLGEVAGGHPVLVLENRGLSALPLWHYSVLAGYDLEREVVLLYAGQALPEEVRLGTFARTWSRGGSFALLALPPGRLPARPAADALLSAIVDLEAVGQYRPAVAAYRAFVARWPADWRGAFGLGNALYGLGDTAGAAAAFRASQEASPARPEPLNNLALLAHGQGRRAEAVALASAAVDKAKDLGLDPAPYEDTLATVSSSPVR